MRLVRVNAKKLGNNKIIARYHFELVFRYFWTWVAFVFFFGWKIRILWLINKLNEFEWNHSVETESLLFMLILQYWVTQETLNQNRGYSKFRQWNGRFEINYEPKHISWTKKSIIPVVMKKFMLISVLHLIKYPIHWQWIFVALQSFQCKQAQRQLSKWNHGRRRKTDEIRVPWNRLFLVCGEDCID